MAITPADFQVMIPRTTEAARMSSDMTQKNVMIQQQQTQATQNRAESSLKQVYSREQAQGARISEKQQESRKNGQRGKNRGDSQDGEEPKHENGRTGVGTERITTTIDIKI